MMSGDTVKTNRGSADKKEASLYDRSQLANSLRLSSGREGAHNGSVELAFCERISEVDAEQFQVGLVRRTESRAAQLVDRLVWCMHEHLNERHSSSMSSNDASCSFYTVPTLELKAFLERVTLLQ